MDDTTLFQSPSAGCRNSRYCTAHPDVGAAGVNPLLHYVVYGDREGRRPIAFFDTAWYRAEYDMPLHHNCLAHFLGRRLSGSVRPSPEFDPVRTLRLHPSLVEQGIDPVLYALATQDAAPPGDVILAASGLFDANFYLVANPDVREAEQDPLDHYCAYGWREGRDPNLYFLTDWYVKHAASTRGAEDNPLLHYYLQGECQGCRPAPFFDPAWYAAFYGLPAWQSALGHYLARRRSCDDGRLLDAGRVRITGEYSDDEAVMLVRSQGAHVCFLPSVWPETWSYTLSLAWQAGLPVVAFDIGAQAERIRRAGRGRLLSLDSGPAEINAALMQAGGTPLA